MSIPNTPYVKFLKGSIKAYEAAIAAGTVKDDTLYFIFNDDNKTTGSLYLGFTKISDGSVLDAEILVDSISIENSENGLSLKDYGKKYYKYVAATENSESRYELVEGWIAGLEPRVGITGLEWYEPNPTTIDGLDRRLITAEENINSANAALQGLNGVVQDLDNSIESRIATAVASSTLLSIKIVNNIEEIDNDIANPEINATKFLYMVPNNGSYDEYVVVNGIKEKVGNTEISLSGYATEAYVNNAIKDLATAASVNALSKTVEELTGSYETLVNTLDDLNSEIGTLKNKGSEIENTLNSEIATLIASDTALSNRIDELDNRMQWVTMTE